MPAVGHSVTLDGRRLRLTPGRHASPGEGACVVELASLIAREKFSDSPKCVCPVIASFLRGWNDRAAYADRQRLLPYAAQIVDTREARRLTRRRRDLCLEWAGVSLERGPVGRTLARLRTRARIAVLCGPGYALRLTDGAGEYASRVLCSRRDTAGAFALLDALLAIRTPPRLDPLALLGNGNGRPLGSNGNGSASPSRVDGDRTPANA